MFSGGESGIRTHDTLAGIPALQASALGHYAIPPIHHIIQLKGCFRNLFGVKSSQQSLVAKFILAIG